MDALTVRLLLLTTLACVEIEPVAAVSVGGRGRGREVMSYAAAAGEGAPLVFAAVPLHAPVPVVRVLSAAPLRPPRHQPLSQHAPDADYDDEPRLSRIPRPNKQRSRPAYQQDADYEESYQFPRQSIPSPPPSAAAHRPPRPRPHITQYEEDYETYAPQPSFTAPSSYVQPHQSYSYSTSYAQPSPTHQTSSYSQPQVYSTLAQPQYEAVYATGGSEPAPALLYARPSPSGGYTYRKVAPKTTTQIPVKPTKESPYIIKIHKYRITKS